MKDEIKTLVEEAAASGLPLDRLRGIAVFDMEKDARLISRSSFGPAEKEAVRLARYVCL